MSGDPAINFGNGSQSFFFQYCMKCWNKVPSEILQIKGTDFKLVQICLILYSNWIKTVTHTENITYAQPSSHHKQQALLFCHDDDDDDDDM
jgi:hypothetical protein